VDNGSQFAKAAVAAKTSLIKHQLQWLF